MAVRIVPLGGLGEIGLNCLAIESDGAVVVVDCGLMFPGGEKLGVEYAVPDLAWLRARADAVRAVLVTHAHEDHVGGLPYLLREVRAPVYGSPFSLGRVKQKLEEQGVALPELRELSPRGRAARLGPFAVEALRVAHSTPQAFGYAVETPEGVVVHTGDLKLDERQLGGGTDLDRLSELGSAGVVALLSDSTNAEREGFSKPEAEVGAALARLSAQVPGRLVISLFGSNVGRVQLIARAAAQSGRRVALLGRSLLRNCELAESLNLLEPPPGGFLSLEAAGSARPRELCIVTTGAQGEPRGGLARLAAGEVREFAIDAGDTVVLSARAIPGNEGVVSALVNALCKKGVRVLAGGEADSYHASGHGHAEDQKRLIGAARPKTFVPIHGEYRMLWRHAETARAAGVEQALIVENGQIVELAGGAARIAGQAPSGRVYLDAGSLLGVAERTLRDRRRLGQDGAVVAWIVVDRHTRETLQGPTLFGRGIPQRDSLLVLAREAAVEALAGLASRGRAELEEALESAVKRAYKKETDRRPVVLPVVVEV